jgi:hypothetical protein
MICAASAKKMGFVVPVYWTLCRQFQIDFVHERGGLQGMLRALALKLPGSQPPQVLIDHAHELSKCFRLTVTILVEQEADLCGIR